MLFLWLAIAAATIAALAITRDGEQLSIDLERWKRRTLVSFGYTLAGTPDLAALDSRLEAHGVVLGAPIFMRIFKQDFELELWMLRDGRFHRFATYPICRWSGRLGPKLRQGDHQAPEGIYTVDQRALNPESRWHRSFNLGFPNAYDRAHGRTGSFLMVHGGCSSIGCYAMTNAVIDEVWRIVTAALKGGQARFQVQVFPFRMTEENLASHAEHPHAPLWRQLKRAHDLFDEELLPPLVRVCARRYFFERASAGTNGSGTIAAQCRSGSRRR